MKTAMQELMEWFYNRPEYDKSSEGYEIMSMCEILLNVEKEQIMEAYRQGLQDYTKHDEGEVIRKEQYYNETYKNEG
jgi:hypothetical protein